jgi:hypothetical protein
MKENEMGGTCSMYGEVINVYKIFVAKPERRRPFGIYRCRWEDNIKVDLRERVVKGVDWIHGSRYGPVASSGE